MKKHLSATLVFGIAAAVSLSVAPSANAQSTSTDSTARPRVTSSKRIPVRKDASGTTTTSESSGAIATPNADSVARADSIAQADAMERARQDSLANIERMRQDSIAAVERARQDSIALAERTRADSIARADSLMRWNEAHRRLAGTGLYFQLAGGTSIPQGTFNDVFQRGYNVTGSIGFHPVTSPLGVRFDVAYDKFNARDNIVGITDDPTAWSGLGELTLRVPAMWAVSPYLVGGGGVTRFSNFGTTASGEDSMTKGQWNAGAGIGFGLGNVKLFLESRYMRVMTPDEPTTFVPIVLGFSF
jgi:opacity protein-like surface antigen